MKYSVAYSFFSFSFWEKFFCQNFEKGFATFLLGF
jgi:hypothetical protein